MATRSAIGFVEYDGSVTGIYCHWDGYLEGVGKKLVEHYSDTSKLLDLIDLGDISCLGPELGEKHPFSYHDVEMNSERYDELYGNMTTAYGRDRGELNCEAHDFACINHFRMHFKHCEYFYLYDGNEWTYSKSNAKGFRPVPVLMEA